MHAIEISALVTHSVLENLPLGGSELHLNQVSFRKEQTNEDASVAIPC